MDTNWCSDFGATDHITGELKMLHLRDCYHGNKKFHSTKGASMVIRHVGNSLFNIPNHDQHLRYILHVPNATKSLLSIIRLAKDNNAFI
jgi:hypothetical protein